MLDPMPPRGPPTEVELLVMPDTTLMLVAAAIEPMRAANRILGRRVFCWQVTTPDGRPAETRAGVPVPCARPFAPEGPPLLLVLASYGLERDATRRLTGRLARAARHRDAVAGLEAGAWLLGWAGLLSGRRATTHWEDHAAFADAFPDVEVVRDPVVIDRARATCAGAGAAIGLMLALVRARAGRGPAEEVARLFTFGPDAPLPLGPGSGLEPGDGTGAAPAEPALARALVIMAAHLADPLPVERIARAAGVSPRHLQILFGRHFGMGPDAHYRALRLGRARRLLIETARPALEIAEETGFASQSGFCRAYRAMHGESPSQTRMAARIGRPAPTGR